MTPLKPILCLDFDGVIHSYASGWQGADVAKDSPVPGAMKFLREAAQVFDVQVHSSRSHQPGGVICMQGYIAANMATWLHENDTRCQISIDMARKSADLFVETEMTFPTEKPPALVSIDDRAITFTGAWPSIQALQEFKPWNKK